MLQPQNREAYYALGQVSKSVFGDVFEVRARFSKISDSPSVVRTFKNPRYWTSQRSCCKSAVNSALRSIRASGGATASKVDIRNLCRRSRASQAASPALPTLPIPTQDTNTQPTPPAAAAAAAALPRARKT